MVLYIGLTYNIKRKTSTPSEDIHAEYDDEFTINSIKESIESAGHSVKLIEADEGVYERLRSSGVDFVFNIAEGFRGDSRESHIPTICEMLGIPYSGSGPLSLSICLNKARTKEILTYYSIPSAKHQVFKTAEEKLDGSLKYPLIVKPLREGSSIGVNSNSVVRGNRELVDRVCQIIVRYDQPAIVEKFLCGREFTVGVIGNDRPYALPVVEIYLKKYPRQTRRVYGFEAKTLWENDSLSGAPIEAGEEFNRLLQDIAVKTHTALGCRDFSRVDIRLDENNNPNVIEANPLPGLNPRVEAVSYFIKAGRLAGIPYKNLIIEILNQGIQRYNIMYGRVNPVESRINV